MRSTGAKKRPPTQRPPPQRPTARPMPAVGREAPKCCQSCLGGRPAKKNQGRGQGGSAANFYWAPKHQPQRPPPQKPTARPMPAEGRGAPKCCRRCVGRRPAKNPRGEDRAEALPIFYWAPKHRRSRWVRPEAEPPRRPTARPMPAGGSGAPKCCQSCLGRRVVEKPRGDDRAEALPIFYWAPKHQRSRVVRPETNLRGQQDGVEALPILCGAPKQHLDRPEENFRGKPDRA